MRGGSRPLGFTLVELIAAMAVMSIILLALASTVVVATRSLPSETHPVTRLTRGSAVLQGIADELAEAITISERDAHAITFTVADRDGDGVPETIRYAWTGSAGDPVTRSYNQGAPIDVADDVASFEIGYVIRTDKETYSGAIQESAEQTWSSFADSSDYHNFAIKKKEWIAQVIAPTLPANAVLWCVTRAKLGLRYKGATDGQIDVQLRPLDDSGLPTTTVLDYATVLESALGSKYTWWDVTFSGDTPLIPGANIGLTVVASNSKDDSAEVLYNDKTGTGYLETNDAENKWTAKSDKGVFHYLYGCYYYPGPDQTAERRFVTAVDLDLQIGSTSTVAVHTAARTANEPELLSAFWSIDSGDDPTADANGDGTADFDTTTALVMNPDLLLDAKADTSWTIAVSGTVLTTAPSNDFSNLTTLIVRFRDTDANDKQGAMVCLNMDWSGTSNTQILGRLTLTASGSQTLVVSGTNAAKEIVQWVEVTDLPKNDLVELRLLADPALDTVNVRVNGVDRGTFPYGVTNRLTDTKYLQVAPWASAGAEFAHVCLRVGDPTP
ncbi:MAG TPA: prepilin-type N-terminal cleavage/methylation domain-containing protein [Phycisphaerae bacterium]|nr:prepilin-type N-terminal cleavage/methylation domain-containing protein [Phycisphaerales bacterium]HRX84934.1 prepilin-type N-terminal cleavage/methylation domain-containing protein [Phycisphaerae bacterium]